tara:strand:- start:510 stop:2789 length:2280 start_codon:yes stop_codon:yes gene_type:complete
MPKNVVITGKVVDKTSNLGIVNANCVVTDSANKQIAKFKTPPIMEGGIRVRIGDNIPNITYTLTVTADGYKKNQTLGISITNKELNFGTIALEKEIQDSSNQNIIGKVIDSSTKEGLYNANINIKQNGKNTGYGFVTDGEGNINSNVELMVGTYTFEISYITYTSKEIIKKITPTTKQLNLNTIELDEETVELNEVLIEAKKFIGKVRDDFDKSLIVGAKIKPEAKVEDDITTTSQTTGEFKIVIQLKDDIIEVNETSTEDKNNTNINTVVVGGISWATAQYMKKQWELAGLSSDRVEFINYNENQKFQDTISNPSVRNIMGFSGGGNLIWPEVDKDFDFIGLIDPSSKTKINTNPGLPSNVKLVSNSNNWIGQKGGSASYLYDNLLAMERNGVSNKWDTQHKQMPLKFFQTYKDLFNLKPPTTSTTEITYKPFDIIISAEGYSQKSIPAVNGDKTLKQNLGTIFLSPLSQDLKLEKRDALLIEEPQLKKIKIENLDFETIKQQAINKAVLNIKQTLIPAILALIAQFGIAKVLEALAKDPKDIDSTCPKNLNKIIDRKNKLTKSLNNIYNFLKKVEVGVRILDGSIDVAQIVLETFKALTLIPSTSVTPIPGSASVQVKTIEEKLKKYKLISSTTLIIIQILIQALSTALQYLSLLDMLVQKCATKDSLPQEQISNDLLEATQQQSQQLSPVVTNVNGFEMEVITVDNTTVDGLKRRRAIARNKAGIIMLQGEPSFSSNDQILIDELVFYIQQNDLKA